MGGHTWVDEQVGVRAYVPVATWAGSRAHGPVGTWADGRVHCSASHCTMVGWYKGTRMDMNTGTWSHEGWGNGLTHALAGTCPHVHQCACLLS